MSRDNGGFKPHPGKISSMLFYLATLIIHDVFRTSRENPSISTTTSYLDLGPLYGSNQEEQDLVRTFEDGLLKPDCFSEKRLLGFPPGVSCLVIMFNRFHNYVARQLAAINENEKFSKPAENLDEVCVVVDFRITHDGSGMPEGHGRRRRLARSVLLRDSS